MDVIEIADGVVRLVQREVVKTVALGSFKQAFLATAGVQTPVLPAGTVMYAQKDRVSLFVLEERPAKRTIRYRKDRQRPDVTEYAIPLPWVYFVAHFVAFALEGLYVFVSPKRIEDASDVLYHAPLTNRSNNGQVCLGDFHFSVTRSVAGKLSTLTSYYWNSVFNTDMNDSHETKMPREIQRLTDEEEGYYDGWQRLPEDQACRVHWERQSPLGDVLDEILGEEADER